jgi:cyclopropane fatty-acyl-phospholipid synthase-like methyltransferase
MSRRVEQALSKGSYEQEELRLIGAVLSPDDVVLEVGAGLGLVSTFCAQRFLPQRRIQSWSLAFGRLTS